MLRSLLFLLLIVVSNINVYSQTTKILFLGNSYTGRNNLPEKVSMLALSLGDSVYFDSNTPGGARLMDHAVNPTTLEKISQDDWDFVVIQAQSQEPSLQPAQVVSNVLPYAVILNDSIKSNNPCSETVFYMTWGRKYGDQQNCPTWPPVCTFLGMQERLVAGYMTMGEQNSSTVAPIGLAWKHAMDNDPDSLINLYSVDYSHPSLHGTYLTACVMYATMFQRSPLGATYYAGLPANDAIFLQQMAEEVVLDEEYNFIFNDPYTGEKYDLGWKSWFDFGNIIFAGFTFFGQNGIFDFIDNSLNAETYSWNFGDGSISSLQNPSHAYTESGSYLVVQSVSNPCFNDLAYDTINVVITSIKDGSEQKKVFVFPNPSNGILGITLEANGIHTLISYEIYDFNSRFITEGVLSGNEGLYKKLIDLSSYSKGCYNLRIYFDNELINKTIIIQ